MSPAQADWLGGTWNLVAWRSIAEDGSVSYPLGTQARGRLMYTADGQMAVQISRADRPALATESPLGGSAEARADAYSGYLAYFGTYELQDGKIVHRIDGSLFPNWCGQEQVRPLAHEDGELVLRTPPMRTGNGSTVVNELSWTRAALASRLRGVMTDRTEEFLELSELLTGFSRFQLLGTGMSDSYRHAIEAAAPAGVLGDVLDAFARLTDGPGREDAVRSEILADPKLGPVTRNIILMWYCGTWAALPPAWRSAYGTSPRDTDHVVSAAAYEAGLQWLAAGAHPAGARQQGYGAWAAAPEGARERTPA